MESGHISPSHLDGARGGLVEAGDHSQCGGLAAAAWPDEGEEFAVGDRQIEFLDRDVLTKSSVHLGQSQGTGFGRHVFFTLCA